GGATCRPSRGQQSIIFPFLGERGGVFCAAKVWKTRPLLFPAQPPLPLWLAATSTIAAQAAAACGQPCAARRSKRSCFKPRRSPGICKEARTFSGLLTLRANGLRWEPWATRRIL